MCLPLPKLEEHTLGKGEHAGFAWHVVHNGMGFRCGYVRVPAGGRVNMRRRNCHHFEAVGIAHQALIMLSRPEAE